jgi:hypothetical protein
MSAAPVEGKVSVVPEIDGKCGELDGEELKVAVVRRDGLGSVA